MNLWRGAMLLGARRGVMTGKRGNKDFYKGRGAKSTGFHTRKGSYIIQPHKVRDFVVPDLTGFKLKPYVSHRTPNVVAQPITAAELVEKCQKDNGN